jgi:hypothetical protein
VEVKEYLKSEEEKIRKDIEKKFYEEEMKRKEEEIERLIDEERIKWENEVLSDFLSFCFFVNFFSFSEKTTGRRKRTKRTT